MLMADIRVVQIVRNGDYSTGNIIITINQLLVVAQRGSSSQNNNSAVEAERQAEAQRNTEAEKQRLCRSATQR